MGVKKAQRYCEDEAKFVLAEKPTPNHILHLLLSIVTVGIWVPVWIILQLVSEFSAWRCPSCGGPTISEGLARKRLRKQQRAIRRAS